MSDTDRTEIILIREGTFFPTGLDVESEVFLPGWRVVKNLDRPGLTRNIERADWHFFYLAGGTRATVLGRNRRGTLRRAVKRVLSKQEEQRFNSLEITQAVSKRFLGIPFMRVTAHFRHIQQGFSLVSAKDFVLRMPTAPDGVASKQYTALISSS